MIEKLMKRYALSEQGAKDFVKCTAITTLQNLMLMLSVAVEYYLVAVLLQGNMTGTKKVLFVLACAATLLLFLWIVYLQYNSSFFATYKETMMEMYLGIYLSLMVSMDYPFTTKPNRRNMKTATVPSFLPNSYRS